MVKLGKQKHTKTESLMGNITLLNDSRSSSIELSVPKTKHLLSLSRQSSKFTHSPSQSHEKCIRRAIYKLVISLIKE